MGAQLAREAPADADVVIPIPDSGVPAAIGYAQESGIPFELGIIRNHYVGRTFIEPEQRIRQLGVKLKHSANAGAVRGNRIVLIDDSVVRGTTSKKIVQMMFEAGAREVHMRISSPPITHPDFYGIDTPRTDRAAGRQHDASRRCASSSAPTSLAFLSVDGIYRALGLRAARRRERRSSPTTASPATTRPTSSTRTGLSTPASCRSCPRCASRAPCRPSSARPTAPGTGGRRGFFPRRGGTGCWRQGRASGASRGLLRYRCRGRCRVRLHGVSGAE